MPSSYRKRCEVKAASPPVANKKKISKKLKPQSAAFSLTIKLGDNEYTSSGETVYDALNSISVPVKIVSKGFVRIERNGKHAEKMLMPVQMKRLFWPLARRVQAKNLELLLR